MELIYIPTRHYKNIIYPLDNKVIIQKWYIGYEYGSTQTKTIAMYQNLEEELI